MESQPIEITQFLFSQALRDYLVRWVSRRVADPARELDTLYMLEDPWHMDSAREQARFAWTNGIISAHFPRLDTLLEVGCGEGHQSLHLSQLCGRLYAIDVSRRALRRASRRCPNACCLTNDRSHGHVRGQGADLWVHESSPAMVRIQGLSPFP